MSRRGFTLIEIMVVVLVIAVLSAMALPSLSGSFSRAALQSATDDVTQTLRYARRAAVLRGQTLRVVITPEDPEHEGRTSFYLEVETTDLDASEAFSRNEGGAVKPGVLPPEMRVAVERVETDPLAPAVGDTGGLEGRYPLRFFADGSADAAMIHLTDGLAERLIVVDGVSGRVTPLREDQPPPPPSREDLDA